MGRPGSPSNSTGYDHRGSRVSSYPFHLSRRILVSLLSTVVYVPLMRSLTYPQRGLSGVPVSLQGYGGLSLGIYTSIKSSDEREVGHRDPGHPSPQFPISVDELRGRRHTETRFRLEIPGVERRDTLPLLGWSILILFLNLLCAFRGSCHDHLQGI